MTMNVGVIGLGVIGKPIAERHGEFSVGMLDTDND